MTTPLASTVTPDMVSTLLANRRPDLVTRDDAQGNPMFDIMVAQACSRLDPWVGNDLSLLPAAIATLATDAAAHKTASNFEYACYPEQQGPNNTGRGWWLDQEFQKLFEDIKTMLSNVPGVGSGGGTSLPGAVRTSQARGNFCGPRRYPDRAFDYPDSMWIANVDDMVIGGP